jgi:beta-glucosidase
MKHDDQPVLIGRVRGLVEHDGLQFRDLDGDGVVSPYEDWRLPVSVRVSDLVSRMTLSEKAGLLLLTSQFIGGSDRLRHFNPGVEPVLSEDGLLIENDMVTDVNRWAKPDSSTYRLEPPVLDVAGATRGITELGLRYLILRDSPSADRVAMFANRLQEVAEGTRLGIPVVLVSNPRNHASDTAIFGVAESVANMTLWPGELGLAATGDPELVRRFAEMSAVEWRAAGIHKGYMYMADLATEPRWTRCEGTFGEDPELASDMISAVTIGFQGAHLSSTSVSLTTKHFPGGGPRDRGTDPHFEHGQKQPYPTPGSLYRFHLPPFRAAIAAGTTSIMPYYARTDNALSSPQLENGATDFAELGFAFDPAFVTGMLRNELGFTGYVNSDTGIITGMPWGVENCSRSERMAVALNAGVHSFSGDGNPEPLIEAVQTGLVQESTIDVAVTHLLAEMMNLGLFENPYVSPLSALEAATSPIHAAAAHDAHCKSIVLLRNDRGLLPLSEHARVYVEVLSERGDAATETSRLAFAEAGLFTVAESVETADVALVWIKPQLSLMRDAKGEELMLDLDETTGIDARRVRLIMSSRPTIVVVSSTNPWVLSNVEADATALMATFGVTERALAEIITGVVHPTGRLPFTFPASLDAVRTKPSDIPGWAADESYAYVDRTGAKYGFGFGLTYA